VLPSYDFFSIDFFGATLDHGAQNVSIRTFERPHLTLISSFAESDMAFRSLRGFASLLQRPTTCFSLGMELLSGEMSFTSSVVLSNEAARLQKLELECSKDRFSRPQTGMRI
jgi:hypothetical protein